MNTELEKRIARLEALVGSQAQFIQSLGLSNGIPLNVQRAFEARLGGIRLSSSSHTGETQAVNESGSSNYSVMAPADGFVETTNNGVTIYIPYFT